MDVKVEKLFIYDLPHLDPPDHVCLAVVDVEHGVGEEGAGPLEPRVEDGAVRVHGRGHGLGDLLQRLGALEHPEQVPQVAVADRLVQGH